MINKIYRTIMIFLITIKSFVSFQKKGRNEIILYYLGAPDGGKGVEALVLLLVLTTDQYSLDFTDRRLLTPVSVVSPPNIWSVAPSCPPWNICSLRYRCLMLSCKASTETKFILYFY